ncbi:MAG: tandem-95 repeat protein, partial [Candidatus Binatia bacterium]
SCTVAVSYRPASNFNGADSFTFKTSDGGVDSNVATISISVSGVDDPAVAVNDFYYTDNDTALSLGAPGVLGNDNDLDEPGNLTAVLLTGPTNAANFSLNPDGSFTYIPNTNFVGTDSFAYTINDGANDSNAATVNIAVIQPSNPPVAINDFYNTERNTPLNIPLTGVIANDNDIDTPRTSLIAAIINGPTSAASFTLHPDGSFDYVPQTNFTGNDSFTYQVNDGISQSNTAMVVIAVLASNSLPVAQNDTESTSEDAARSVPTPGVLANDSLDPSATSTAILVSGPKRAFSFTLNDDGSFAYIPAPDFSGFDSFTYRVFDGAKYGNVAMVNVEVVAVNDSPDTQGQSVMTNEDTPLAIALSASDVDNTTLTYAIVTPPSHGVLGSLSASSCAVVKQGSNCSASIFYTPASNYHGSDSFTYSVSDGHTTTPPATVLITILRVNNPPVANAGGPYSGNAGSVVLFTGTGSDPDGDSVTLSWTFGDGGQA